MLKILHIAPQNYAGVPYDFYNMHNKCGDFSRIITLHKNTRDFPEDICLNLPLPNFDLAKKWRKKKVELIEKIGTEKVKYFEPKNFLEKLYFNWNDFSKKSIVEKAISKYSLNEFDIIHYDAGLDFYRNAEQALKWKRMGKKIVCCYYGSDLRVRGIIKELDKISDLNITSEYDHLAMKEGIQYIFYPYDPAGLPRRQNENNEVITIVHSPTNRKYKGTDLIISVIEKIQREQKIKFILMENQPRCKVLEEKSKSDICIDQVGGTMGGTGYGKAGIESLAMSVPTITNMTDTYREWLPENPFNIANNEKELYDVLNELIDNAVMRKKYGENGKKWVEKYHSYKSVNLRLKELYKLSNII